jgi:hypothetical protein
MFAGYRASRQASTPTHADRCASAVNRASSSASRSLGARAGERAPAESGRVGEVAPDPSRADVAPVLWGTLGPPCAVLTHELAHLLTYRAFGVADVTLHSLQ